MAWTQTQLDELDSAIAVARGTKELTIENQTWVSQPIEDLLRLREAMQQAISAEVVASTGQARTRFAATSKGV